jgi:uncharacterized protein YeaO (DUF488 family)
MRDVEAQRLYDVAADGRGHVLVDRLWPRGIRRDDARVDHWCPEVAPSPDLRRWYAHQVERFAEFAERYRAELATDEGRAAIEQLLALTGAAPISLLTAARDLEHSQAAVLADLLRRDGPG